MYARSYHSYYAAFGEGTKKLVVMQGLSDGLATVKDLEYTLVFFCCAKSV